MRSIYFILLFLISFIAEAQKQNNIWCFGDSAGIDFNNINNPQPYFSVIRSRGSCVSICDTSGNLICYAAPTVAPIMVADSFNVKIYNRNNLLLQNGDSIVGEAWYYELVLVPTPGQSNLFYLFSIGITTNYGLYYSIIDMNQNGGQGAVIQKNIQLLNYRCSDGLTAIKHGNGRDWWILFRRGYLPTNDFYIYLLSPAGIQGPNIYSIGTISNSSVLHQIFSPDGNKLMIINAAGIVELFDFDRCTGIPTNPKTIEPEICCPYPSIISGAFSPNGNLFYVSTEADSCYLIQFNLLDTAINNSRDTIYYYTYPPSYYSEGLLKLGPDKKIYVANGYYNGVQNFYPYQDSMYNTYNMNLSVINSPDSLGLSCNFQAYSFYLGGKRTYLGLPNNPDYSLGPIAGSICDSLTNVVINQANEDTRLKIFYHSSWKTAFINAQGLKGLKYTLMIFDINGKEMLNEEGDLISSYLTRALNVENFASGVYLVSITTKTQRFSERFVKE